MRPVILASTSAARRALFTAAGVAHEAMSPGVDEDAAKASLLADNATPREVADALAELKAVRVSAKRPGALVIGADQVLDFKGRLFDKAKSMAEARERLRLMRGESHQLHSAVVVALDGAPIWREVPSARLTMRPFTDDFLDAWLERQGEGLLSSVACYKLEDEGVQLFSRIEGDYFTILGLPMIGLLDLLRRHGALPL
ncbi:septum formation protein Maf [Caulobacter sp. SLTY]|uniref:Maf family protein n=1 Tax=Caulobacter sp. SLTY TaxID=2683262 RepID=UPI001411F1F9|nr:septum formation protein Maf [Caulobacter sp. SLTY]